MADAEPLRRLGGGRWQTTDGRFTVEPQAGTWMVVDAERTDDLGLPLVRGPFRSLGAARSAIDSAREEGDVESPLAERVAAARAKPRPGKPRPGKQEASKATRLSKGRPAAAHEPTWLTGLDEARRGRARDLLSRLGRAGVADAEAVARAEFVDDEPAVARVALERRLRALVESTPDRDALARALLKLVTTGEDATLGAGWRLVDTGGRPITGNEEERRRR